MLGGNESRNGLARRELFFDEDLHDRQVLRLFPDRGELGLGDEPGGLEQVDDQLTHELRDRGWCGGSPDGEAAGGAQRFLGRHRSRLMSGGGGRH